MSIIVATPQAVICPLVTIHAPNVANIILPSPPKNARTAVDRMSLDPSAIDTNNDIMDFASAVTTTIDGDQINEAAASTTMKRDLRSSMQTLNPLSSNRGLKNSSVFCYSNSYLQVLASYRGLPDCLRQLPSDNERRFPIHFELATIISLIRCGQGNPVCTETFTRLFWKKIKPSTPDNVSYH